MKKSTAGINTGSTTRSTAWPAPGSIASPAATERPAARSILVRFCAAILLSLGLLFSAPLSAPAFAVDPETSEETPETAEETPETTPTTTEETPTEEGTDPTTPETEEETGDKNSCQDQTGSLSWIVCPSSGIIAGATDALYAAITDLLEVAPISMASDSPVYLTWQYARNLTNIVFIIFLIIVIYSQLTGLGLNNYGVKRILPRLIIAVLLVNLSFIISSLAVDVSNIVGASLRDFFTNIETTVLASAAPTGALEDFSLSTFLATVISGGAIAGITIGAVGGTGYLFFMLLVVLIGALIAVVTGLITIAARQALVALLIMISPLAFVAYLLPNTEKLFNRWKDLLIKMLIFYPTFSFLFGASHLVGYTLIASASSAFGIILGIAVQIFPLFFGWSLMKMSGTILGSLNNSLRRLSTPIHRGATGWALGHAEQARQFHLANSTMPGAKLRRYLDYRRELRELDTRNSMGIRKGRAVEATLRTASSSIGRDADGNPQWSRFANRYTANAKRASLYETRGATAAASYKNTLSAYGRHFAGDAAARLSSAHAEAYKDAMAQQFLTVNEAQADQEWLLNQYLDANAVRNDNPYEYNRLVKSAAGGLGHLGESSIMGQVIIGNSTIENRRRSEARIIATKFGIDKPTFRGMVFDKEHISDNGIATDSGGRELENDQYRLKAGNHYTPWQQYIGVDSETGEEISKDEYDAYTAQNPGSNRYKKVRYFDIKDDKGNSVQRVYEDDAGYMKELLRDDVAIGDPINRRYLTEIGVGRNGERNGILRRYHSTISAAMLDTRYKEHAAEVTPMITAQANMGYIRSIGQYNIANLQSLSVASKPNAFLQNDAYAIKNWAALISTINDPDKFAYYFPDEDIMGYLNVNKKALGGMYLGADADGNPKWIEIDADQFGNRSDAEILELRKNLIKHKILPKAAKKLIGMLNRNISPNVLENQKPDTLEALIALANTLSQIGIENADSTRDFTARLDGNQDLFSSQDPNVTRDIIRRTQAILHGQTSADSDDSDDDDGNPPLPGGSPVSPSGSPRGSSGAPHSTPTSGAPVPPRSSTAGRAGTDTFLDQLERHREAQQRYNERNNLANILNYINDCCNATVNTEELAIQILDYFEEVECLRPLYEDCRQILEDNLYDDPATSTDDAINQVTDRIAHERERIERIRSLVADLIVSRAETT